MKIQRTCGSGFTLVEIMIVVAIIGLLATIAIPNFMRARTKSQQNACIHNLRQIDGAVQQWALEHQANAASAVTSPDIEPYLGRGVGGNIDSVFCPAAGSSATTFDASYAISRVDTPPLCQIGGGFTMEHSLR